ncbi:DUF4197 domain-containing protein [Thalassobaculum sp.]|uniref:DUF4197 domain-containing protein n=1 Tax=Thalassobaculum sp. TaxID=2022740 RepID=UPI0032ED0F4B
MHRRTFVTATLASVACVATPAWAQSLFDKAGSLLGGGKAPGLGGNSGTSGALGAGLSNSEITSGLKEALRVATGRTVDTVGRTDGYFGDPNIHIPLPGSLKMVKQALDLTGHSDLTNDLELKLNRAAEAAAPQARDVFVESIQQMTLDDAAGILNGPKDSATQYFKRTMSSPLKTRMHPIVDAQLSQVGAVKSLDAMMGQAKAIPGVPSASGGLTDYTLDAALKGVFFYLAKEEAAIRDNPAARTTDLLKKVFG